MKKLVFVLIALLVTSSFAFDLKWSPVTKDDWNVEESDSLGIHDAVLLFEKGHYDETGSKNKYYYHRRIKIFNERGKEHGEIEIPYISKAQKYKKIKARTLTPDGQILEIHEKDIREEDVIKAGKLKIKQKQFVMPGMVDGCIIEYMYELEFETSLNRWTFQNDIYTMNSIFQWEIRKNTGIIGYMDPEYKFLNCDDYTPSIRKIEKNSNIIQTFELANIPVLEKEEFAPAENEVLAQVRIFTVPTFVNIWGVDDNNTILTRDRWSGIASMYYGGYLRFLKKRSKVSDIIKKTVLASDTKEVKAKKLYKYVTENIENIEYSTDEKKKFKKNKNINDVITRGYGNSWEINQLYSCMLRELDMDATIGLVTDRSTGMFHRDVVDSDQFDLTVVVLRDPRFGDRFFCPGIPSTPYGYIPWFAIGTQILALREYKPWTLAKAGNAMRNVYYANTEIEIQESFDATCTNTVELKGQYDQTYKLKYRLLDEDDKKDEIFEDIYPHLKDAEIKEYLLNSDSTYFCATTKIKIDNYCMNAGDRLIITPALHIKAHKNPFEQEKRKNIILFDFPYMRTDNVTINIPAGYIVEEMPNNEIADNEILAFHTKYSKTADQIRLYRQIMLKGCFIRPEGYKIIKDIYDKIQKADENQIVLKKVEGESANE